MVSADPDRRREQQQGPTRNQSTDDLLPRNRKIPWRLSPTQKARQRRRLRAVDTVVEVLSNSLAKTGQKCTAVERWKAEMPTEAEMLPRDKYTMFDRKAKRYRKGIHSTSASLLLLPNPPLCVEHRVPDDRVVDRAAQVDSCQPETQPSRFLREERWSVGVWSCCSCIIPLCNRRRYDGIQSDLHGSGHKEEEPAEGGRLRTM
mgnify:CR=1 FL=1